MMYTIYLILHVWHKSKRLKDNKMLAWFYLFVFLTTIGIYLSLLIKKIGRFIDFLLESIFCLNQKQHLLYEESRFYQIIS